MIIDSWHHGFHASLWYRCKSHADDWNTRLGTYEWSVVHYFFTFVLLDLILSLRWHNLIHFIYCWPPTKCKQQKWQTRLSFMRHSHMFPWQPTFLTHHTKHDGIIVTKKGIPATIMKGKLKIIWGRNSSIPYFRWIPRHCHRMLDAGLFQFLLFLGWLQFE